MANNQQKTSAWGGKFRSFGSSIQKTMNDFTGMDKSRPYRAQTVSAMNSGALPPSMNNNAKSPSGARKYQSGRRRSIERSIQHQHSPSVISIDPAHYGHHSRGNSLSSHSGISPKKTRKRSLLWGRAFHDSADDHGGSPPPNGTNQAPLPPNFYPPEAFVNFLYRVCIHCEYRLYIVSLRICVSMRYKYTNNII